MASPRRMGSPEAKNRAALLDAAEQIMLEEGYPAASSRRVAEKAGLKHQLVHYYFHGMDELFTASFRRSAERGLRVQAEALKSPQPLWALWKWHTDTVNAPLWTEYIAMANHRKGLRAEIAYYSKRFREEQRWIMDRALKAYGVDPNELPAGTRRSPRLTASFPERATEMSVSSKIPTHSVPIVITCANRSRSSAASIPARVRRSPVRRAESR